MSETDLEEQKNELLALKEIIGEDNLKVYVTDRKYIDDDLEADIDSKFFKQPGFKTNCKIGGSIRVAPVLSEPLRIFWTDQRYFCSDISVGACVHLCMCVCV